MERQSKIITVAGKGGVGKTSISATIVKLLVEKHPDARILAIDADPAVGLSTALGIEPKSTIDNIRETIISDFEEGRKNDAIAMLNEARYRILDTLEEKDGFAFLAIGRPEAAGCYCKVNSYLKEVISLISKEFDYVVIDGEAGIEQINRRVMEKVTHLILITDPSKKGTKVIQTIRDVAKKMVMYDEIGAIVNRICDESAKQYIDTGDIPVLAYIDEDKDLSDFDIQGKNIFNLPKDSNVVLGVTEALKKINII